MVFRSARVHALVLSLLWLAVPSSARAEVYGGIEIGAKGIRAIAVDVTKDGDPKILMVKNENTTLVADLAVTKQYAPKALEDTATIVGHLAETLRSEFKLTDKRLHVMGSSGLFVGLDGDEKLIEKNKEALIDAIRKKSGVTMDFVTVVREAELTIVSVVPRAHSADAVLLDIGSGNTKGGGEKAGMLMTFSLAFGTVSFSDRVKQEAGKASFVETAAALRETLLAPGLSKTLEGKSELAKRNHVYLAGGSVWALTTFMKPLDRRPYVPLTPRDFEAFHKFLLDHPAELPNPELGAGGDEDRKAALNDLNKVRQTFSRDQLVGGVEILKALSKAFELEGKDKQIVFARNAYIGWILGYTVEKGNVAR